MKHLAALLTLCVIAIFASSGAAQSAITPKSLVGDWEWDMGSNKAYLHLSLDASGALTGSIDMPGLNPPHQLLSNIRLKGAVLTYSFPSRATNMESIDPKGETMLGNQMWTHITVAPTAMDADLVGDWIASPGDQAQGPFLRIRKASSGLTGTYVSISTNKILGSQKIVLTNVHAGQTIGYTMNSGVFQGRISTDGKSLTLTSGSTTVTWNRFRTAAEALAADAKEKPSPLDGAWQGSLSQSVTLTITDAAAAARWGLKVGTSFPQHVDMKISLHSGSNPTICTMDDEHDANNHLTCKMTLDGNKVHIDMLSVVVPSFDGTLSGDGSRIVGTAKISGLPHVVPDTAPLTLLRVPQPRH